MATKPTDIPEWNTGGANNTEPSSGEKILGWEVNQVPPSSWFNWMQKLYGEWIQYLNDGIFTGGLDVTGAGTDGSGIIGRGSATGDGAGVEGFGTDSAAGGEFVGGDEDGTGVSATGGATNGVGAWGVGTGTGSGVKGEGGATNGIGVEGEGAGAGAGVKGVGGATGPGGHFTGGGTDPAVYAEPADFGTGIALGAAGYIDLDDATNPAATDGFTNKITPNNIIKAFGTINTGATPSVTVGFNLHNTTPIAYSGSNARIKLRNGLTGGTAFCVSVTGLGLDVICNWAVVDADEFDIVAFDSTGATYDLSTVALDISFMVLGPQ